MWLWQRTKFTIKDLKNWLKNIVILYLFVYVIAGICYGIFESNFVDIIKPGFFLGVLVVNILIWPLVFLLKQTWNLFKK